MPLPSIPSKGEKSRLPKRGGCLVYPRLPWKINQSDARNNLKYALRSINQSQCATEPSCAILYPRSPWKGNQSHARKQSQVRTWINKPITVCHRALLSNPKSKLKDLCKDTNDRSDLGLLTLFSHKIAPSNFANETAQTSNC